jgi:broad specificity phosphatase PhoE
MGPVKGHLFCLLLFMEKEIHLILIRHGETAWNKEGRVQGFRDIELNDTGLNQARKLASSMKDASIQAVYSSPLKRARQTALIINEFHHVPMYLEAGLMEMDQGDFEGFTYPEMKAVAGDFLQKWVQDPAAVVMPNGESLSELQNRAWPALENIIRKGENAVIVSHNFTIAALLCKIQNVSLSQFRTLSVGTASKTVVSFYKGSASIDVLNERTHLDRMDF